MFERTDVPTNSLCPSDQMSTYTDLYDRIHRSLEAFRSFEYASAINMTQPSFRTQSQTAIGETSHVTLRLFRPCLHSSLSSSPSFLHLPALRGQRYSRFYTVIDPCIYFDFTLSEISFPSPRSIIDLTFPTFLSFPSHLPLLRFFKRFDKMLNDRHLPYSSLFTPSFLAIWKTTFDSYGLCSRGRVVPRFSFERVDQMAS